jgi:hypothetical protein
MSELLEPLRVHQAVHGPPGPWQYRDGLAGSYASFYTVGGVKRVRKWLEGVVESIDAHIAQVSSNIPKGKPRKWEQRALAEIEFMVLCMENNRFYMNQYLHYLDVLIKDPGALAVLQKGKDEDAARESARKARRKKGKGGRWRGVPYVHVYMPRLLKQRCERFAEAMGQRPPIYGEGAGQLAVSRFKKAFRRYDVEYGVSTWSNFFELGWQRQYHWRKVTPTGGGGGGGGRRPPPPKVPKPPRYQPPAGPTGPSY